MKTFIHWFFDNLFSEPLNNRLCWSGIGMAIAYIVFQLIRAWL